MLLHAGGRKSFRKSSLWGYDCILRTISLGILNLATKKKTAPSVAQLQLVYDGPEVKDGTLRVEDMVDALIGFGRAYDKIADLQNVPIKQHLRVTGIKKASADILISALSHVDPNVAMTSAVEVGKYTAAIVTTIVGFIQFKKHMKGAKPKDVQINSNNGTINVFNNAKVVMELPKRDYELYNSGLLDSDLDHLTRPLEEGRVNAVEFRDGKGKPFEGSRIEAGERDYFSCSAENSTTTQDDVQLEGEMKSLNKDSNSGLFHLNSGKKVRYKLVGKNPHTFWKAFAYSGPVRVRCRVHLDSDLNPTLLEIYGIDRLQRNFFVSEAPTPQKQPTTPQRELPASGKAPVQMTEIEDEEE